MLAGQKRLSTHCWTMKRLSCASWTTCEKWLGDKWKKCQPCPQHSLLRSIGWRVAFGAKLDHNAIQFSLRRRHYELCDPWDLLHDPFVVVAHFLARSGCPLIAPRHMLVSRRGRSMRRGNASRLRRSEWVSLAKSKAAPSRSSIAGRKDMPFSIGIFIAVASRLASSLKRPRGPGAAAIQKLGCC